MKKALLALAFVFTGSIVFAQVQNPVNWTYSAKKLDDKTYEVHLTATIQKGWHLYSQKQPKDAIAEPTSFAFAKSPLLKLEGKVEEKGTLEKYKDKVLGIYAHHYSNTVDFVQVVKLKAKTKTAVTGTLAYQTCNDQKCLPPKSLPFSIALN